MSAGHRIDAAAIRALLLDEAPVWAVPLDAQDRTRHRAADSHVAFCGQAITSGSHMLDGQGYVASRYERCERCEARFKEVAEGRAVGAEGNRLVVVDIAPVIAEAAAAAAEEDAREQHDRARTVRRVLESCEQELARLENIPTSDPDDVNALSAAKGFVERAEAALAGRFA